MVFDAVTKEDSIRIIEALKDIYPRAFWAGSLGLADALAQVLYGDKEERRITVKEPRCVCFTATAYSATKRQIAYSRKSGLKVVELDIDGILDGNPKAAEEAVSQCLKYAGTDNFLLRPRVEKYSGQPGTNKKILFYITECSERNLPQDTI